MDHQTSGEALRLAINWVNEADIRLRSAFGVLTEDDRLEGPPTGPAIVALRKWRAYVIQLLGDYSARASQGGASDG